MNILVACEESQRVCIEFRKLGHNAFSCDIVDCSGGHPEWHIMGDVLKILNPRPIKVARDDIRMGIEFYTGYGQISHTIWGKWDMIIAFPPCTYLTITGNRWFNVERYGEKAIKRLEDRERAKAFFMAFVNADCPRIAIENPVGIMSSFYKKPSQIIQPWQFAIEEDDLTEKTTCLWLIGLPDLVPITTVKPEIPYKEWIAADGRKKRQTLWYYKTRCLPHSQRAAAASKTFFGIARAMATQWG